MWFSILARFLLKSCSPFLQGSRRLGLGKVFGTWPSLWHSADSSGMWPSGFLCPVGNMKHQKTHLTVLCSLRPPKTPSPHLRPRGSLAARFMPTGPSPSVWRMGCVPHFRTFALSPSLHHVTQHLKVPEMGTGHFFHESVRLIPDSPQFFSGHSVAYNVVFLCLLL